MPDSSQNRRVALAFLAHPDDAEILCAGTLIRLADAGWEIHIATATRGDCGSTTLSADEIMSTRSAEAAKAASLIDARFHTLDERDAMVVFDKPTVRKTLDLFRQIAPTLVFTHPRQDYMMDHEQVHLLAREASFAYAAPNVSSLPLIEGSRVPHLYFCDPLEGIDSQGNMVAATTFVDIAQILHRKAEMLACHVSQREWLRAHHGMDEYIVAMHRHAATRGKEVGVVAAEAFVQHRGHSYPRNDVLLELLGTGR